MGSLLFTAASYLAYAEAVHVPHERRATRRRRFRPASWEPGRIDWLSAATQLVGTLLFNVSTFLAMQRGLDARQTNLRVWAPDALGSVCFLVASALAYARIANAGTSLGAACFLAGALLLPREAATECRSPASRPLEART